MNENRDDRDLLIRISTQLEHMTTQMGGLAEKFTKLETQTQDINQRGLLQQTAIERGAERTKSLEDSITGEKGLNKRVEVLEDERLVWKTQLKIIIVVISPVYAIALLQVGKFVSSLIWGTP